VEVVDELPVSQATCLIEALSGYCQNADVPSAPRPPLEGFAMCMFHANRFTEIEML
jgi:hypothetical protein